jgi:phage head maturation protease
MDVEGKEVFLETAQDLWDLLVLTNPAYDDQG